jgi:hypothetical protein
MLALEGSRLFVIIGRVRPAYRLQMWLLMIFEARRSLLIAAAIQPDSLDIVLTRLLVYPVFIMFK